MKNLDEKTTLQLNYWQIAKILAAMRVDEQSTTRIIETCTDKEITNYLKEDLKELEEIDKVCSNAMDKYYRIR